MVVRKNQEHLTTQVTAGLGKSQPGNQDEPQSPEHVHYAGITFNQDSVARLQTS